jgi:two-component system, sensor histidine kinase LadS
MKFFISYIRDMRSVIKKLIVFIFSLYLINPVLGQDAILQLDGKNENFNAVGFASYFETSADTLGIEDVSGEFFLPNFKSFTTYAMGFGITSNTYWVRLPIQNLSPDINDWYLLLDYAQNGLIEVYLKEKGILTQLYQTGFLKKFDTRPVKASNFAFPLHLEDQGVKEIYLKIQSDRAIIIPLAVVRPSFFYVQKSLSDAGYGVLTGILVAMFLYNLFLYLGLRDKAYLFYIFSIMSSLVMFLATSGNLLYYVFPDSPKLSRMLLEIASACLAVSAALFAKEFLKIANYSKWLNMAFNLIVVIGLLSLPLMAVLDIRNIQHILYNLLSVEILLLLTAGIISWRKKNKYAGYFVIAWLGYLIGGLITMARDQALLPFNFFTTHAAELGSVMEVILLSIALSSRYQTYRKEKEEAIEHSLRIEKEANETLEKKVIERTVQLQEANEELNTINEELNVTLELVNEQKDELESLNVELEKTLSLVNFQKDEIEHKNKDITASINYAKRIQSALLPEVVKLKKTIPEHFIFYRPRDIVSGDFYWFYECSEYAILAVADCTGHGVPGAFMSMIGDVLLNQIVVDSRITNPDLILNELHKGVRNILKQGHTENRDGMDISICTLDYRAGTVEYAGAMSSMYYIQNNALNEIKGDRYPIGGVQQEEDRVFTRRVIDIDSDTVIYMFSDGYKDQFGGKDNRKYMAKKFRENLFKIHQLSFEEQKAFLENEIDAWMEDGRYKQTDDMLVVGFKLAPGLVRKEFNALSTDAKLSAI